ncbi:MAG: DNA polymerase, partial [Clostridiaceae bacterium]|nr:DNA polymerase [Clostridiaceae bacterium]
AADILKHALGLLASRIRGSDKKIVAIVHDEILMEVPVEEADDTVVLLKTAMEEAAQAILPDVPCETDAKAADSWAGK